MNSATASSQLSRAIVSGSEKGVLVLPKGMILLPTIYAGTLMLSHRAGG